MQFSTIQEAIDAIARGGISVTPLQVGMSDPDVRERLQALFK